MTPEEKAKLQEHLRQAAEILYIVKKCQLPKPKIAQKAEALSVDGGTVRLRTALGQESEWRNYKALKVHEQIGVAFFRDNEGLIEWINQQSLSQNITCLGDGHDGIWNIIQEISHEQQRREVLDWYHLKENLYRVGGSIRRLKKVEHYLWQGFVKEAIEEFEGLKNKKAQNFQAYLRKHQKRIPDYQLYQELKICIGSGSVESLIKQIASRVKITGAQWNKNNISQMLTLRCAYLNGDISLSTIA
ncbi:Uncharacterized protein family (UPF0236) [Xenococcus sp. PCC 7305]|uniref:hypothetical protein n=1 Tax=Xenococcus sp. PCC 7305 TaxID=102125 RepID=UPI0002ACC069|nr:hypothetical protein [Xenococcus sp. PCC 7305]ELS04536.1 Uncharacterized protein family (UPF0236) [Xenococcus sp. PCC 7305]